MSAASTAWAPIFAAACQAAEGKRRVGTHKERGRPHAVRQRRGRGGVGRGGEGRGGGGHTCSSSTPAASLPSPASPTCAIHTAQHCGGWFLCWRSSSSVSRTSSPKASRYRGGDRCGEACRGDRCRERRRAQAHQQPRAGVVRLGGGRHLEVRKECHRLRGWRVGKVAGG
eukprot:SAG11_NODE_1813_length_4218_cov_6.359553_3_plen_170_part_00